MPVSTAAAESHAALDTSVSTGRVDWLEICTPFAQIHTLSDAVPHPNTARSDRSDGLRGLRGQLHTWTVDALPPAAAIHSGPTPVSASTSATFTFAAPYADGTKLCQLDDGGYSQCHSPMTYTGGCACPLHCHP